MNPRIAIVIRPGTDRADIERVLKSPRARAPFIERFFWDPLIDWPAPAVLEQLQQRATARDPDYIRFDPDLWLKLELVGHGDFSLQAMRGIVRFLRKQVKLIADAYLLKFSPVPSVSGGGLAAATALQAYLESAPTGVGLLPLWREGVADCTGGGIGITDIEVAWDLREPHPALPDLPNPRPFDSGAVNKHDKVVHGINVLGILFMKDPPLASPGPAGGVGMARDARPTALIRPYSAGLKDETNVAQGVLRAIAPAAAEDPEMLPGDVLLIEVEEEDDQVDANPYMCWPVEIRTPVRTAIRLASALGIIVIEPAGNWNGPGMRWLESDANFKRGAVDSRAILVGACEPATGLSKHARWSPGGRAHRRYRYSRYGERVDCFAWGDSVRTTATTASHPQPGDPLYGDFNGTSSASAIIAGCALVAQGLAVSILGTRLSPREMRDLLCRNGTRSLSKTQNIGVMPNLEKVLYNLNNDVRPDIYLRHAVPDNGAIPSKGVVSGSPDIIVKAAATDPATLGTGGAFANADGLSDPYDGSQDQFIYLRVRNRGKCSALNVQITLWWTRAGLRNPATWKKVGETTVANAPAGGVVSVAPVIRWAAADKPKGSAPFHLIAVAGCDNGDPAPDRQDLWTKKVIRKRKTHQTATQMNELLFAAVIRAHNNVGWLKVNGS